MRWILLTLLVAGCSFDQSGLLFADSGTPTDGEIVRNPDGATPITDAGSSDASLDAVVMIDAPSPPDAALPDALDEHPVCTTDIECENQFGPFHCCYVGWPANPPGICVEGHFEGGLGCVPADGELPDAGP